MYFNKNKIFTASVLHLVMGAAMAAGSAIPLADMAFAAVPSSSSASGGVNPVAVARGQQPNAPAAPERNTPLQLAACNPCAARKKGCGACNPCAAKKACSPCNPCAAKKACSPCNPCAAKKASSPCGPCNPCNPCGAGAVAELTAAEARNGYDCLIKDLAAGYAKSGLPVAGHYRGWKNFANQPYVSDTHGGRYVNNYGNSLAASYGRYEEAGRMPVGAMLAKDSFAAKGNGKLAAGPLFLMEKMAAGFNKDSGNWRYTMVLPSGQVFGTTNGAGSAKMQFCYECHMSVAEEQDSLMFLPDEYRAH